RNAHTDRKEHDDDIQKSMSPDIHSTVFNYSNQKHMTGNMSYLSDFEEINRGYVAFGGNPKGGKITGKGKFQGKVDEGFLVGYSMCSKAFRVFNSRTRIVQETFHVTFMENKPNVAGSGPAWLFDIDSLTQTMDYHPSLAKNQSNTHAGFQDTVKAGKEGNQTYVLFPVLSDGSTNPKNNNKDALIDGKEYDHDIQKSMSPDIHSSSCEFTECINNSSNGVNAAGSSVSTAELNFTNNTNDFSAAGPSNAAMPNLEDLSHNAYVVGVEADTNNMESIISVSPIPTTRIHKDHPTYQIIGDLSLTTQTRNMARAVRDQEVFAPVARIEAIRLFLAYASFMGFPVYQMDVKSSFLYGTIEEEVYVCQPPRFEDLEYPDKLYKVVKALYGLHQAPRAWVLVSKPHNKTPYELLHGRLPSIGFMRPFGCPVTILNTLDPLGKFQGKVDEEFLVGYSICSKAFRVFNSRTRIVQETLHVNFMENKPNVVGSGPAWLFDIDSLSQTMNYHPVLTANQTNSNAGFQDTEKAREEGTQIYVLFPVLSDGSTNPKNNKDAHSNGKEHDDDIQKFVSPNIHSSSCGDQTREQGDKAESKDKGKSPIVTITGFRDLNEEFAECFNNSSNEVNDAGSSVSTARLNFINNTNDFSAAGPSNAAMPNLKDLSHNADDVGAEMT
nr:putative ribonuclease H-like domain-containing protein [Tanacetum cinerariifolium]